MNMVCQFEVPFRLASLIHPVDLRLMAAGIAGNSSYAEDIVDRQLSTIARPIRCTLPNRCKTSMHNRDVAHTKQAKSCPMLASFNQHGEAFNNTSGEQNWAPQRQTVLSQWNPSIWQRMLSRIPYIFC